MEHCRLKKKPEGSQREAIGRSPSGAPNRFDLWQERPTHTAREIAGKTRREEKKGNKCEGDKLEESGNERHGEKATSRFCMHIFGLPIFCALLHHVYGVTASRPLCPL